MSVECCVWPLACRTLHSSLIIPHSAFPLPMPIVVHNIPFIRSRKRGETPAPTPPGAPLVLVSASWEVGGAVTVTFDRAVDVSGIVPAALVVNDGPTGFTYQGISLLEQPTAQTLAVECSGTSEYEGPSVMLNVSSVIGIVAADDGGTWAGVTDLELPFP